MRTSMVWVLGLLALPVVAGAQEPVAIDTVALDVRVGYGGALLSKNGGSYSHSGFLAGSTSYSTRTTHHGVRAELELRWIPSTVGLRVLAGVSVGQLSAVSIEIESDYLELFGGDRSREILGRARATRIDIGLGPVFRKRPGRSWGPMLHLDVLRNSEQRLFAGGVGFAMSVGRQARAGFGLHIGTTFRGASLFLGWRLTVGFGAVRKQEHREYD